MSSSDSGAEGDGIVELAMTPIGFIRTPYQRVSDIPRQGYLSGDTGEIHVDQEFEEGLRDVESFSHLIVLYYYHGVEGYALSDTPPFMKAPRGIFSIRSPRRPNHIGLTVVKLLERSGNVLKVTHIDMLDGTPLLDIKPYIPEADSIPDAKTGLDPGGGRARNK